MRKCLSTSFFLWVVLVATMLPHGLYLLPDTTPLLAFLFGPLIQWTGNLFSEAPIQLHFYSDSFSRFIAAVCLFAISFCISLAFRKTLSKGAGSSVLQWLSLCYLAYSMFNYGIDKVLHRQFYTPNDFVLFTEFGRLDRDLLYWSTMGLSPMYSLFLGTAEVLAAVLLAYWRTRVIGLVLSVAILINVVAVNLSFDISVKMHSTFLLLMAFVMLLPNIEDIIKALMGKSHEPIVAIAHVRATQKSSRIWMLKTVLVIMLIIDSMWRVQASAIRDSGSEIFGAYSVEPNETKLFADQRYIIIHSDGFLILQNMDAVSVSRPIKLDGSGKRLSYINDQNHAVFLDVVDGNEKHGVQWTNPLTKDVEMLAYKQDARALPALRKDLHFFIDWIGEDH